MTRQMMLEIAAHLLENGLDASAQIFSGSADEVFLRLALFEWQERNCWVVYGMDSPQPDFVRAALAFGNLRLMQREFCE